MRFEQRERLAGDVRNWLAEVGALLLIAAGLAGLHLCGDSVCLFHRLTGFPCLTCGTTRAAAALASGNLAGALRLQPLAVIGGGIGGVWFAVYTFLLFFRRRVLRVCLEPRERCPFWVAAVFLVLLNWLYLIGRGI